MRRSSWCCEDGGGGRRGEEELVGQLLDGKANGGGTSTDLGSLTAWSSAFPGVRIGEGPLVCFRVRDHMLVGQP